MLLQAYAHEGKLTLHGVISHCFLFISSQVSLHVFKAINDSHFFIFSSPIVVRVVKKNSL